MQSFIFIGKNSSKLETEISNFVEDKGIKSLDFNLDSIDSVRQLNSFIKVARSDTAIVSNIDKASDEAMNAFLKNLEEPKPGIYYLLSAKDERGVLSTILSRCQIIRVAGKEEVKNSGLHKKFNSLGVGEKLDFVSNLKSREEALEFINNYLLFNHNFLVSTTSSDYAKNLRVGLDTLTRLRSNGNVALQMTRFVLELV